MDFLVRDLRFAARALLRSGAFFFLVVATIAMGVGANTAIFTVVNALVFRPLPFHQPDRLVLLDAQAPQRAGDWMYTSYPDFVDWRAQSRSFSQMAAFYDAALDLSGTGDAERAPGAVVSDNLFATLGVKPVLGRTFTDGEGKPGASPVVVLGHALWERRFGGETGVLGETLRIGGRPHTVVGVMPEGFRFPEFAELWIPIQKDPAATPRDERIMAAVGRLAPGVELDHARSELATLVWRQTEAHPQTNEGVVAVVKPLRTALRGGDTTRAAVLFQGITLLVLLIAWANVANLLLARSVNRRREMSIRAALGATRGRAFRQLAAEGLVLAACGGTLGLLLGWLGRNLLVSAIPITLPFWISFGFDWRVLAFACGMSIVGVLVFTAVPALQAGNLDLQGTLRAAGGRGGTGDVRGGRMQGALVVAEMALAVVLLISAGLMVQSVVRLQRVDAGFDPRGVATARLSLPAERYPSAEARHGLWARLVERAATLPGVEAAAAVSVLPLTGGGDAAEVVVEGRPPSPEGKAPFAIGTSVTPGYFRTLGIPLRAGRAFDAGDGPEAVGVAVVNETMARRMWPGESPVGQRIRFGSGPAAEWREVVGVAGDVKDSRLSSPTWPTLYLPLAQSPVAFGRVVVRARAGTDPARLIAPLRAELRALDPALALDQTWTMQEVVGRSMWMSRLYAWLAAVFGGVALLLAAVGTYGVLGYTVRQRTQEIGIRAALGAGTPDIVRLFVRRGLRLAGTALLVGLPIALGASRLLASMLFGMGAADVLVFAGVSVVILTVALLASFVPAYAAARVEPSTALRCE